jgi:hypothetical protein
MLIITQVASFIMLTFFCDLIITVIVVLLRLNIIAFFEAVIVQIFIVIIAFFGQARLLH